MLAPHISQHHPGREGGNSDGTYAHLESPPSGRQGRFGQNHHTVAPGTLPRSILEFDVNPVQITALALHIPTISAKSLSPLRRIWGITHSQLVSVRSSPPRMLVEVNPSQMIPVAILIPTLRLVLIRVSAEYGSYLPRQSCVANNFKMAQKAIRTGLMSAQDTPPRGRPGWRKTPS